MGSQQPSYHQLLELDWNRRLYWDAVQNKYMWGIYDDHLKTVKYTEVEVEKTRGWDKAAYESYKCRFFVEDDSLRRELMTVYSTGELGFWNRSGSVKPDRFTRWHIRSATGVNFFELLIYSF